MPRIIKKLQGVALDVERTGEFVVDEEGEKWEKCIFTVELKCFSKRTPNEKLPEGIEGKEVKIVRYCCFDWHFKLGVMKTLDPKETEDVLTGNPCETVWW
ncbi:MAG: hypothetical protein RMJ07_07160 [Nitrososphaerota archaeon]|nr:hypothetical protein [Candidatus Bathyarchaeota archaeon]MDW8049430.1 hypothetical protein [Nitrososphaerota archaeon]